MTWVSELLWAVLPLSPAAINICLGLLLLGVLFRRQAISSSQKRSLVALGLFLFVCLLSAIINHQARGFLDNWALVAFPLGLLVPNTRTKRGHSFFLLAFAPAGLMALTQTLLGTNFHRQILLKKHLFQFWPAQGFFTHHLTFAPFALVALLFSLDLFFRSSPKQWRWLFSGGLAGLALLASQSRTYWLAAAVAMVIWAALRFGKRGLGLALGVITLGLVLVVLISPLRQRMIRAFDPQDASRSERTALWKGAVDMIADRPILGFGPGDGYRENCEIYRSPYAQSVHQVDGTIGFRTLSHCHNLFLQIAVESGIPGAIAFLIFCFLALSVTRKNPAVLACGIAILLAGFFEYNLGDAEVATLWAWMLGRAATHAQD